MKPKFFAIVSALAMAAGMLHAQAPAPVVVQANVPAAAPAAPAVQGAPGSGVGSQALLQTLQQMKAANDETLRKQQATLQQLDELQKAVEQIKVYTKRG